MPRILDSRPGDGFDAETGVTPGSLAWQALEEVLLEEMDRDPRREAITELFCRHGYVLFYEERLASKNVLIKASAIDKLGRMRGPSSTRKLLPILDSDNPEILSVTVRALSRIRAQEGLVAIVQHLAVLLGKSLVTRKVMETALLNFGEAAIPHLIDSQNDQTDAWVIACVLETLAHFPPDIRSVHMAVKHIQSTNPEVRSKTLKVLGRPGQHLPEHAAAILLPLLGDPVWFVRLQAIKSVGVVVGIAAAEPLGKLLFDMNWRVRSEAARVLARFGDDVICVFLDALMTDDVYARESICEEIELTRFADRLIDHLAGEDDLQTTSREILRIMHSLGFSTPLTAYLDSGADGKVKEEVRKLVAEGVGV